MRIEAKTMSKKRWGSSVRNSPIFSIKSVYPRGLTGMPPLFCLPGKPCRDGQSLPSGSGNSTSLLWNLCPWSIPSSVAAKIGQSFTFTPIQNSFCQKHQEQQDLLQDMECPLVSNMIDESLQRLKWCLREKGWDWTAAQLAGIKAFEQQGEGLEEVQIRVICFL